MVKLYLRHCTKKRSKITFIRVGFFLCTGAWPQYAGLQVFLMGLGEGSQGTYKNLRGLRGPDGEVVIAIVRKNGRKSHL